MEPYSVFPDNRIETTGPVSKRFLDLGITDFAAACRWVHELPYGYNSDRDDLMILFKEKMGSCTTKHAVIATLAAELEIPVDKSVGIYPMTEELVTGTREILERYGLPYLPMVHCYLVYGDYRVDLSEGNQNGKNGPIDDFLYTETVTATISGKDEYLLYRKALKAHVLPRKELEGIDLKTLLKAREEGISLLRSKVRVM
jgi:hypothetical protein